MSDDKPKNAIDMPFQAGSDTCVMINYIIFTRKIKQLLEQKRNIIYNV